MDQNDIEHLPSSRIHLSQKDYQRNRENASTNSMVHCVIGKPHNGFASILPSYKSIIMSPSAGLSTQTLIEAEIAVDAG